MPTGWISNHVEEKKEGVQASDVTSGRWLWSLQEDTAAEINIHVDKTDDDAS